MVATSAITAAAFWFMVKTLPGLLQYVGFVFGILSASWLFDEYFQGNHQADDE
jgi:hypothetical protein